MTLDGIGEVRADAIIRARPFKAKTELVERRLIPEALYEKIADKVIARPPPATPPTPTTSAAGQKRRAEGRDHHLCARHAGALAGSSRGALGHSPQRLAGDRRPDLPDRAGRLRTRPFGARSGPARAAAHGVRTLIDPLSGEAIDRGLVVWFEAPNTETGETMAELHLHGGRAVVRRAGGDASWVSAGWPSRASSRAAPSSTTSSISPRPRRSPTWSRPRPSSSGARLAADGWRAASPLRGLAHAGPARLAHLEAAIDFPDEDLPAGIAVKVMRAHTPAGRDRRPLDDRRGERLRDGLNIAIIGPPNAGKSSLLNLLARRDAAIVSETAGTTRDVIEVHLDLGG